MCPRRAVLLATAVAALAAPSPCRAARGGPDAFGYTWADSDEAGVGATPPDVPAPTDLRATYGFQGDDVVVTVPIPTTVFPNGFPFYGVRYGQLWLSSNGWLSFTDPLGSSWPGAADVPSAAPPNALVAFFRNDWTLECTLPLASAGETAAGDGYMVVVDLGPKGLAGAFARVTVTLWQTGAIQLAYQGDVKTMKGLRTAVGIEDATGSVGLPYMSSGTPLGGAQFREDYAVSFYPPASLDCSGAPIALSCGQPATPYSNAAGSSRVTYYGCAPGAWDGNEARFTLDVPAPSNVTIDLVNTDGRNRSLFLLRPACDEVSACRAGGSTTVQQAFATPGRTYGIVVDGKTAGDNGSFTLAVQCVPAAKPVACNTTLAGESTSGTGVLTTWSCAPGLAGPENLYAVTVGTTSTITATLANKSDRTSRVLFADASIVDGPDPSCLAASLTTWTRWGVAPGTYYVAVDSLTDAASYDLSIGCARSLVCPSPPRAIDVTSPTAVTGDTTGKPDRVETYFCADSAYGAPGERKGYNGPEDVWEFTLAAPTTVWFKFAPSNPDLRLLILDDCYEGSCRSEGGCGESLPAGTYRLVVDGLNGAAGSYSITPVILTPPPYNRWTACPECWTAQCTSLPGDAAKKDWRFDSRNFCGTGCDFSMFAAVGCGTSFHVPLRDVETGHMKIRDYFGQRYVDLVATNDVSANAGIPPACLFTTSGPLVQWEDPGCARVPCPTNDCGGGSDCRTQDRVMDVSFQGSPLACGLYRLDFLDWGGFVWDALANCTGDAQPQFDLFPDLCTALVRWRPLPEGGLSAVAVDGTACPNRASGTLVVENVGCLPVTGLEVTVEQAPPLPPGTQTLVVDLQPGETKTLPWSLALTAAPATIVFTVDPANRVAECSEDIGAAVACGIGGALQRTVTVAACGACTANVMPPGLGNVLRAVKRAAADVVVTWTAPVGAPLSLYRLYEDGDRQLPPATRSRVAEVPAATTTAVVAGEVPAPPPAAYYQVVGVSCARDLEGPY